MGYSLVNLWDLSDRTLFDGIELPDGVDQEILVNTIFDEGAELEPVIMNPELYQAKIQNFFKRNLSEFKRLYEAMVEDYEPLENYRRIESGTAENKIAAFDADDYQNSNYNETGSTIYGNVGVTTSQEMLEAEISLRAKYNIYQIITNKFINELLIACY